MVCSLPAPQWLNPVRAGLQSAIEDTTQNGTTLSWGEAISSISGAVVFYNIYFAPDLFSLFDAPQAFSLETSAFIPNSLAPDGYFFGVRASQLGVAADFSTLENMEINDTVFAYPLIVHTTSALDTSDVIANILVDGYSGFPTADGYLSVGEEVIQYSSTDGYSGGSFVVSDQNPFGCNDGYLYSTGSQISLFKGFEDANTVSLVLADDCLLEPPVWYSGALAGLERADDLGIGTIVQLFWGPAIAPTGVSQIYYSIYISQIFDDLFFSPTYLTIEQTVIIPNLNPGEIYYFAVRASYYPFNWDINELEQVGQDLFAYPTNTVTKSPYLTTDLTPLTVNSTEGFPEAGFLLIDAEILEYDTKTSTTFNIVNREVFGVGHQEDYESETPVKLYHGIEDGNLANYRAVPSWDQRVDTPRMPVDGYLGPDYLQDSDGYRDFPDDNLTEDHTESETENDDRPDYPFCGYRATNFVDLYTGNFCATYIGGRQDGFGGGVSIADINLQREELLLGLTGAPFILLRRKWTGKVCSDITHRQEHPPARCPGCFGTGFVGGYDRYFHPRQIRPGVDNPNGFLQLRVEPYQDDLDLNAERGLTQIDQVNVWCTALPQIKDRDILIRYLTDDQFNVIGEEFRYTIEYVNRNKILFNLDGRQQATIKRLDKTHTIYTFDVDLI